MKLTIRLGLLVMSILSLRAISHQKNIRMVVYEDFSTSTVYRFITNNFELPSLTISELYRERWSVELFFKWIKQHLKIKSFYGTSRNAVYSQIWIAICTLSISVLFVPGISVKMCQSERWCNSTKKNAIRLLKSPFLMRVHLGRFDERRLPVGRVLHLQSFLLQ